MYVELCVGSLQKKSDYVENYLKLAHRLAAPNDSMRKIQESATDPRIIHANSLFCISITTG